MTWALAKAYFAGLLLLSFATTVCAQVELAVSGAASSVGHWHPDGKLHKHGRSTDRVAVIRTATILPLGSLGEERALTRESGVDLSELRAIQRLERAAVEYRAIKAAQEAELRVREETFKRSREILERALPSRNNDAPKGGGAQLEPTPKDEHKALADRISGLEQRLVRVEEDLIALIKTQQELARRLSRPPSVPPRADTDR